MRVLIGTFAGHDVVTIPTAVFATADAKLHAQERRRHALAAEASRAERTRAAMRFRRFRRALKLLRGGLR
jgi:hypothetical protein